MNNECNLIHLCLVWAIMHCVVGIKAICYPLKIEVLRIIIKFKGQSSPYISHSHYCWRSRQNNPWRVLAVATLLALVIIVLIILVFVAIIRPSLLWLLTFSRIQILFEEILPLPSSLLPSFESSWKREVTFPF